MKKIAIMGLTILALVGIIKYDILAITIETVAIAKERVESRKLEEEHYVEEIIEENKEESNNPNNVTDVTANIIVSYMEGLYNIENIPNQEISEYLLRWFMADSVAYEFYKTNGDKLITSDGKSIIKNIEIKSAENLISEDGLLQIRTNEIWVFANGDKKEFTNDYAINKTERKPIIQEIKMDELKDFIANYK
ncbi:MAG: hypothetical protein K0R54_803 [Clostridiaceae bacterium]|jgi:hypothetical protein|nr:hypothetical protein [Clostridiaceae bacterium]